MKSNQLRSLIQELIKEVRSFEKKPFADFLTR